MSSAPGRVQPGVCGEQGKPALLRCDDSAQHAWSRSGGHVTEDDMPLIILAAAAAVATFPIVVTASRTPVSEALSGTAVSVVDADEIEALGLPLVSDYLRLVPSVAVASFGPLGALTEVRIRGAENRHTLTFIDSIEANDPASSSIFQYQTLLADGIDRIEVLRGPQSALWGAQAIGGVVNVINRVPAKGLDAFAQAEGGSFGTFRGGAGGGWGNDVGGITAQANYLTSKGYDISATPGGDKDGYENLSLSAKGVLHATEHLELGAAGRYSNANSQFDDFDYTNGVSLDAPLSTRIRTLAGRAYATLSLFDDRWSNSVQVAATDAANINRNAGVFQNRSDGSRLKLAYQTSGTARTGSLDHRLTLAVEHERQTFASTDADPTALSNQRRDRAKTAVIAEYRVELPERFAAGVSVRHDDSNRYPTENTVRATLAGQFGGGFGGHASYGEGVSDPTFFDLYGYFPAYFVGNPNLRPEHARSVDAGAGWSNDRIKLDVTGYTSRADRGRSSRTSTIRRSCRASPTPPGAANAAASRPPPKHRSRPGCGLTRPTPTSMRASRRLPAVPTSSRCAARRTAARSTFSQRAAASISTPASPRSGRARTPTLRHIKRLRCTATRW